MIADTPRYAGPFALNGSTNVFPFAFKVFQAEDVRVYTTDGVDETDLLYEVDYTIELNADQDVSPGGTITTADDLSGGTLIALSNLAIEQPAVFTNNGGFYPRVLNDSLDRSAIIDQQLYEKIGRSLLVPLGESALTLSSAATRANKLFGFDAQGRFIAATGIRVDDGMIDDGIWIETDAVVDDVLWTLPFADIVDDGVFS